MQLVRLCRSGVRSTPISHIHTAYSCGLRTTIKHRLYIGLDKSYFKGKNFRGRNFREWKKFSKFLERNFREFREVANFGFFARIIFREFRL